MKSPFKRKSSYTFGSSSLRQEILKALESRRVMILICTLVVLECIIVMSELMVDLHGIGVRFENEEKQVQQFLTFMRAKQPELYGQLDGYSLGEVLQVLQNTAQAWDTARHKQCCKCSDSDTDIDKQTSPSKTSRFKRSDSIFAKFGESATSGNKVETDSVKQTEFVTKESGNRNIQRPIDILNADENDNMKQNQQMLNKYRNGNGYQMLKQYEPFKTNLQNSYLNNKMRQIQLWSSKLDSTTLKTHRQRLVFSKLDSKISEIQQHKRKIISQHDPPFSKRERHRRSHSNAASSIPDVFIFSVNSEKENFFIVTDFGPLSTHNLSQTVQNKIDENRKEYKKYQDVTQILACAGFAVFSGMFIEIMIKLVCRGCQFFKKKVEVFDAAIVIISFILDAIIYFLDSKWYETGKGAATVLSLVLPWRVVHVVFDAAIVIISFILDAIFLDSKWYETGKGAATVLLLVLPWRVVHVVNNFLSTINHKHHIEIMTVRRAKKKCETKLFQLKELMLEVRRDVDLLVNLSKMKGATNQEISACIYGQGRRTATLAAITSFTSLMFISTLGKRDPREDDVNNDVEDELYGNLIRDILEDDHDDVTDHTKHPEDILEEKDDGETEDDIEHSEVYTVTRSSRRSEIRRKFGSKSTSRRRATMPRRHVSCSDAEAMSSYVNDGYVNCDEISHELGNGCRAKSVVKSLPSLKRQTSAENPVNNLVTFEVRTEVSYL